MDVLDQRHDALGRQHRSLQRARIAGRGDLNHEGKAAARDLPQGGTERPRVTGPEHEPRDRFRREGDLVDLAAVGVDYPAGPRFQAFQELRPVERRNVAAVAGRDNHRKGLPS